MISIFVMQFGLIIKDFLDCRKLIFNLDEFIDVHIEGIETCVPYIIFPLPQLIGIIFILS